MGSSQFGCPDVGAGQLQTWLHVVRVARRREVPVAQIGKDSGISDATLSNWLKRVGIEDGVRPGSDRGPGVSSPGTPRTRSNSGWARRWHEISTHELTMSRNEPSLGTLTLVGSMTSR